MSVRHHIIWRLSAALALWAITALSGAPCALSAEQGPKPPVWVGIYTAAGKAGLKWTKVSGAARYRVYRSISSGRDYQMAAATTDVSYVDPDVRPGETYYYALKSVSADGVESAFSEERYIKIPVAGGGVPVTPPVWVGALVEEKRIKLAWLPSPSANALAYNVYRSLSADRGFQLIGSTQDAAFTDTDVKDGQTYFYALTTLDKEFKETAFGEVREVLFRLAEVVVTPPTKRGEEPEALPERLIAKPTKIVGFITKGKDDKPLLSPTDIALAPDGTVVVSDSGSSLIQVFKPTGEFVRAMGGRGVENGKFTTLLGLAVDKDGHVFAADAYAGRIQKFDKDGDLLMVKEMAEDVKAIGQDLGLEGPIEQFGVVDLAVADDGRIYALDNYNHCVVIYTPNGGYVRAVGGRGREPGLFLGPTFITFDKAGRLYVSDCFNARVQVFDKEGKFLWSFGGYGNILGTFSRPKGVAFDAAGRIYVSDSMSNVVQVFDEGGKVLFLLGDERGRQMDVATPNGLAVDDKRRVYMVEKLINRVQVRQVGE